LKGDGGGLLSALYLVLNSHDELDSGLAYEIVVRGTLQVTDFDTMDRRLEGQKALDRVISLLHTCDGIDVKDGSLVAESDMSIDDLRLFRRWDYDDLSARSVDAHTAPDLL
jgi:hypothetical protein